MPPFPRFNPNHIGVKILRNGVPPLSNIIKQKTEKTKIERKKMSDISGAGSKYASTREKDEKVLR